MLLPVLLLLFLGAWTAANLIDDNNAAAQATRAGARLAAELGNGGYPAETLAACQASNLDPCQIDKDIIDQVLPIVSPQLTNAKVIEIDIYQPSGCTGITPFASGTCPPNNGAYCTTPRSSTVTPPSVRCQRADRPVHRQRHCVHTRRPPTTPSTSGARRIRMKRSSASASSSSTRRPP